MKRAQKNARVCNAVKFVSGPRREPLRFHVTGLSRTQVAERRIDFGFEVVRGLPFFSPAQNGHSVAIHFQFRAVRPKNDRRFPRIGLVFFIPEALDHGVPAAAIDDS